MYFSMIVMNCNELSYVSNYSVKNEMFYWLHGYKRAVIPNPTEAERKRARLDRGEEEEKGQGQAVQG